MLLDAPPEPWLSFLNAIDVGIDESVDLHCMGGFAVVQAFGLARATADIDVLSVVPYSSSARLLELAGKASPLRRRHKVYLDVVTVTAAPENYADRLVPLYPCCWKRLHLFVLEAHDLALTKLERNFERDRADVEHLARSGYLNAATLRARYFDEYRPYTIGPERWHDQTLELWIEAYLSNQR